MEGIKDESRKRLVELRKAMCQEFNLSDQLYKNICVFTCGSLGRLEMTSNSDLDLFFIVADDAQAEKNKKNTILSNIHKYNFFSSMYKISNTQGYSAPSKGGAYWEFITQKQLNDVGSREEDFNNGLTARLLLILESKPIFNELLYNKLINDVLDIYFADYKDHTAAFHPLYLMNDILRYWYTLTLNYEYSRNPSDDTNEKCWKRLKLKYARKITCYSMIACLYKKNIVREDVISFINMTPFERLDDIKSFVPNVENDIERIKKEYKYFLQVRNESLSWWNDKANRAEAFRRADHFHNILIHSFMKKVEDTNPELKQKTDIF